jgi:hypothetical protein
VRISPIRRISHWGLGIACIFDLAACGAADQHAGAPSNPTAPQATAISAAAPTATPKETSVPDQKPTQSPKPGRATLQPAATLVPEGAAPVNTPIGAAPATVQATPIEAAKADLARRRAVAPDTIRIVEVRDVTWPDPGLGCPQPGMAYKQVPVDGLLIRLESGGQLFEYHSGGSKAPFLCEQPTGGNMPYL